MPGPRDILVVTASDVNTYPIKQYLRPVSAHIVASTNFFSDFLASFSDTFGGRSNTYQKQLKSLYAEAIERIKVAAYEIGANCVIGLSIDMDEISGKGKSMFMLTAIGTAIILEKKSEDRTVQLTEKYEVASADRIKALSTKKLVIAKSQDNDLPLNSETWNFITDNQVHEVFNYVVSRFQQTFAQGEDAIVNYYKNLRLYVDGLPYDTKVSLLYAYIAKTEHEDLVQKLVSMIKELQLFDFTQLNLLLTSDNFKTRKRGLGIFVADKPFYTSQDIETFNKFVEQINTIFPERGTRTQKKQLLSSKEKDVWVCECGKTNDISSYCGGCGQDIKGFKQQETKPDIVLSTIEQKVALVSELIK